MTEFFINPFRETYEFYLAKHWFGPLPLPKRKKETPPNEFTGKAAEYPTKEQLEDWCKAEQGQNICLRLAGIDKDYEVMAIDVDHYRKGDRDKLGGDQLKTLEEQLGPLPETWICTARVDGISGHRLYRVPRGLSWVGKVDKDIDVISKGYRYSMTWPSINPDVNEQVWWFPPGTPLTLEGRSAWSGRGEDLPDAITDIPVLQDAWINYLTHGRIKFEITPIDMNSSGKKIDEWVLGNFHGDDDTEPCFRMREKLDLHIKFLEDTTTFHDLIKNAHWNLTSLAFEGHHGWNKAVDEYNAAVMAEFQKAGLGTTDRGSDPTVLEGEIFRSLSLAVRKIKAKSDSRVETGAFPVDPSCARVGGCGTSVAPDSGQNGLRPAEEYALNDDGNALHFYDTFSNWEDDKRKMLFHSVDGMDWIVWEDEHWSVDRSLAVTNNRWQRVVMRQVALAENLMNTYTIDLQNELAALSNGTSNFANVTAIKASLSPGKRDADDWMQFSRDSGNRRRWENMLIKLKAMPKVTIPSSELDSNPFLLGVANGVVELSDSPVLREARYDDYITMNTNVAWEEPTKFAKDLWQDYLDTFVPSKEVQHALKIAMGYSIMGGNPKKKIIVLWGPPDTGKSTMISAIKSAMGDLCESVNQSLFQNHKLNPILADAITKRVVICSEFDESNPLALSMLKTLSGGEDDVRAEKKGSNEKFGGVPQFVIMLATNTVPKIPGGDKAFENRLIAIPFNHTPKHLDASKALQIKKICPTAILWWLVEGYKEFRELGDIPVPAQIQEAKREFMAEIDTIAMFAHDCLEQATDDNRILTADMYGVFEQWWRSSREHENERPSQNMLTRRLKALGYEHKHATHNTVTGKYFIGVKLTKLTPVSPIFKAGGGMGKSN